jgi:hypothetical protein
VGIAALISAHTIDGKHARRADGKAGNNPHRGSRAPKIRRFSRKYGDDKGQQSAPANAFFTTHAMPKLL